MSFEFFTPLSNVTPFTYRDGETYLSQLRRLRQWSEDMTIAFNEQINKLVEDFDSGMAKAVADAEKAVATAEIMVLAQDDAVEEQVNNGPKTRKALESTYVSITEAPLNARRYGAKNDGVTDDSAAYQSAVNALPGDINAGGGTVLIDGQSVWGAPISVRNKAGVKFASAGGFQSFVSALPSVANSGKPLIGVSSDTSIVRGFQMENVNIDMLNVPAHAIEISGGFDNIGLSNCWVRGIHANFSGYRLIPATTGDGISQSMIFDNVQAIRQFAGTGNGPQATKPLFYMEKVHEVIFRLTKAISNGYALGGVGYEIVDSQQVTFDLASASNLESGWMIKTSAGGDGSQAITIRDPYFENVKYGVVATGVSEDKAVLKIRLKHPRVMYGAQTPLLSAFYSTHARLCEIDVYDEKVHFMAGAYMNQVNCIVDNVDDSSGSGFNEIHTAPNGVGSGSDWNNRFRLDGNGIPLGVDQTGMLIAFSPYGGPMEWRRVKMGAEGSGGPGYRTLIAPN